MIVKKVVEENLRKKKTILSLKRLLLVNLSEIKSILLKNYGFSMTVGQMHMKYSNMLPEVKIIGPYELRKIEK